MNRCKIITAVAALPLSVVLLADAGAESHHQNDTNKPDQIDYDTARNRLQAITTDPDVLAGFERAVLTDDFDDGFLKAIVATRISLAHVFQGRGEQFIPA
jgi:hypothetical protein